MNEFRVGRKTLKPVAVSEVSKGNEKAAIKAMRRNGADDVLVKVDDQLLLVSGRWTAPGVKTGMTATVNGKSGKVVAVNNQINTPWEGQWLGTAVTLSPFLLLLFGGQWQQSAVLAFGLVGMYTAKLGVATHAAMALFGATRGIDLAAIPPKPPTQH